MDNIKGRYYIIQTVAIFQLHTLHLLVYTMRSRELRTLVIVLVGILESMNVAFGGKEVSDR